MASWIAWLVSTLFFAYQYVLRVMPAAMVDEIIAKFDISSSIFGQISGTYYIAYTAAHIPIGLMLDHLGAKKVISFCALLLVIGMLPMIYSDSWLMLNIGRMLIATGSSAGVLGVFKVLRMYFPTNQFALLFGISITVGYFGAVYAGQPIRYWITNIGMEQTILCLIGVGLLLAVLSILCISDKKTENEKKSDSVIQDIKNLFKYKEWLYISFLGGLMIGPMEGFADGWSVKFLTVYYPYMDVEYAAFISSLIFLGFAISAPLIGYIMQKASLSSYYLFVFLLGFISLISFSSILYFKLNLVLLSLIFILIGMTSNYQSILIIKSTTIVPEENSSLASACCNMVMMIFGYFFHTVISLIINTTHGSYSEEILFKSMLIIPTSIIVALFGFGWIIYVKNKKPC